MITQQELKDQLDYDPLTGIFTWKTIRRGRNVGSIAGGKQTNGYRQILLNYRLYLSHRLAWLYMYGEFPKHQIDHINKIKDDNRISNLREATHIENSLYRHGYINPSTGHRGIYFNSGKNKFYAYIVINSKKLSIGSFKNIEAAISARQDFTKNLPPEIYS